MAAHDVTTDPTRAQRGGRVGNAAKRLTTETKQFFKTSEWWSYVLVVLGILIAGNAIEGQEGGTDYFAADKVWLYITILTVGYLLSRGIAKSGVRDPYWESQHSGNGSPVAERVKAAADAFREGDTHQSDQR